MAKKIDPNIIQEIKRLRSKGYSFTEIRNKLKIGSGTVFKYVKGITIPLKYQQVLLNKRKSSIYRKAKAENLALKKAKKTIGKKLTDKEKLLILSSLYWGEGNKKDFSLINTDPKLIKIIVFGLKNILNIPNNRIKQSIRIYEDMDKEKCINYWSSVTNLPIYSVNILKGKKIGKLEYGMCRIRVLKGGDVLKYMNALKLKIIDVFCPCSSTDRTGAS